MATTGWLGEQTVHQWGGWGTRFTTNVYISGIKRYSDHVDVSGTIYLYCKSNGAYSVWYDWNITSWSMGNNLGQIKERTYTNNILNRSWGKNFTVRINCSNSATSATFNAGFSDSNMGGRDKYWTIYFDRYATAPSGIKSTSSYTEYSTITTSCSGINWGQGYSNRTLTCTASYTFNGKTENFTLGTWTDGATSKTVTKNDFNFPADLNVSIKWIASTNVGSTTSSSQVRVGQTYPAPNLSEVSFEGSSPSTYKLNATVTGINYGENYSKREANLYFDYALDGISCSTLLSSISDGSTSMTVEYDATTESEPWKFIPDDEKGVLRLVVDNGHRTSTKSSAQIYCQPQYEAYIVESIPDSEKEKSEIYTGKNIQIQDAPKDAPLADFKLCGNTEQDTLSGKNLAKLKDGTYSYSAAGQTWNIADGVIRATRTDITHQGGAINIATGAVARWAVGAISDDHLTGSGGTYTLTFSRAGNVEPSSTSTGRVFIYGFIYDDSGSTSESAQLLIDLSRKSSGTYTFNLDADKHLGALVFYSQFISYSDVEFKVQLEQGTATDFEPYCGGIQSPNPDYPQDIRVVTGENVVKVTGKNILKPSENLQASRQGLTNVVNDDGSITTSGKPTANWNSVVYPNVDITDRLEDGATYTISQRVKTNKLYLQVNAIDKNTGTVQYIGLNNATSKSFTVDKSSYTYSYLIQSPMITTWGDDTLAITNYYQLEKSSQATDFEPYQEQTYEINLGKNLFDKNAQIVNGYTYASDGSLTTLKNCSIQEAYIPVKPSTTYTLHTEATSSQASDFRVYICEYDSGKGFIKRDVPKPVASSTNTIITTANTHFVRLCFSTVCIDTLQFEAGSTATAYAPYFEPIELCKLGKYQDYIWKDGSDWKIRNNIAKVVLNSSYPWVTSSFNDQKRIYLNTDSLAGQHPPFAGNDILASIVASHFTAVTISALLDGTNGIGISTSNYLSIRDNSQPSAQSFIDMLDAKQPKIYYALRQPTDTVITEQTLIEQLEAIRKASLQNGTNNITNIAIAPNLTGDMEISYYTKWQDTFPATLYSNGKNGTGQFKQIRRIGTK